MLGKVGILLFYFFFFEGGVKIYSVFVRIDVMYRVINGLNFNYSLRISSSSRNAQTVTFSVVHGKKG